MNIELYQQLDDVAMESTPPPGPVITGIFMVELEVLKLSHCLLLWRRYFMFLSKYRDIIFATINNFHPNINFTFEEEVNNMSFLDVLLICQSNGKIDRLFSENKQTLGFTLIETRSLQITFKIICTSCTSGFK